MFVKVKRLNKDAKIPMYAHPGDAGLDLYSIEKKVIKPKERTGIRTGISLAIPKGYVGLVWDKSGLALKEGLTTLAGVCDSGYRGELTVVVLNTSGKNIKIEKDQKVAQFLIQPINNVKIKEVEELDQTSRGEGGFGSTGKK